jgi:uncharacterized RDD family membrane protein YckC
MQDNRFISDEEIDKILGRIGEFKASGDIKEFSQKPVYTRTNKTVHTDNYNSSNNNKNFTFSYLLDENTKKELAPDNFISKNTYKKAGFIRVTYAFITDICIITILSFAFLYIANIAFGLDSFVSNAYKYLDSFSFLNIPGIILSVIVLFLILSFIYFVYFESLVGQTLGKMFMNVKITDTDGQKASVGTLLLRTILFYIPIFGLFGLHNKLSKTRLVKDL